MKNRYEALLVVNAQGKEDSVHDIVDPQLIDKLKSKFKLDPEVYRQHYQCLREKTEKKERKEKPAKKLARSK